ncbi:hypothetical protein OW763_14170 [Clostridium aestuarii]|uniref:Replication protein n=1 Tax=Clostridium aestuarii TaxID=338193 RepID=A0ABT4D2J9_9CLOT|nr:hypothetical protein [Clostridium aestuarii]MCY6485476.1 hypothetical protein [Clostridium aestuarii]
MKKTKDLQEKQNNIIIKSTAKIFHHNVKIEGVVEGNTVQLPFIAEYRGVRQTGLEYVWYTKDKNGNTIKRGIFVSGHGEYGVPDLSDYDTLIALQRLFIYQKTEKGICELITDITKVNDDYLEIEFTIDGLAKHMGYKSPNNVTRNKIKKSLKKLVATTIENRYEGGIYDIRNKKYVINRDVSFHYLESREGYTIVDEQGNVIQDVTKIRFSKFFYEQLVYDYKLFYNVQNINKTKNKMAKKLYLIALQWKGNNSISWANLNTLMERIPMKQDKPKYRKQYVKRALKELNDKKIVKIKYDEKDKDKVYFIFDEKNNNEEYYLLNKYNKFSEIQEAFYTLGFSIDEIDMYLDIEKIKYIKGLLRYVEVQKRNGQIKKDIKQYFISCLKKQIEIDFRFMNL